MNNELNLENVEPKATFESQTNELSFDAPKSLGGGTKDYEKLENLPSINNKKLIGNKTLEELGITDVELITELKPESIEEDLKPNQVYNGNAVHDLARLFGMTLAELVETLPVIVPDFDIEKEYDDNQVYNANAIHQLLELFVWEITQIQEGFDELYNAVTYLVEKEPLVVTATFTLATQKLTNISHYYNKIKQARDNGQDVKLQVTIAESGNIATADISVLDISKKSAFFYPIMRTNIGFGNEIYFFDVEIRESTGSLASYVLQATSLGE